MGAYKKLNKQDAFITTYTAHKHWAASGSQFDKYGIQVIPELTAPYSSSLAQLYYPKKSLDNVVSHSFDYYTDTTLHNAGLRNFSTSSFIISIPRTLTGTHLKPGAELSFTVSNVQSSKYVESGYWLGGYTDDPQIFNGVNTVSIFDDGEGGLYASGSNPRKYVGDIIYPHGMIVITDGDYTGLLRNMWTPDLIEQNPLIRPPVLNTVNRKNLAISWQSSQPIFTHNYHCKLRESEYNFTYNITTISGSVGTVYDNNKDIYSTSGSLHKGDISAKVTGSAFQPYITTVGLYNDANQLIAVGKMTQPLPKPANTEMTIIVKIDI